MMHYDFKTGDIFWKMPAYQNNGMTCTFKRFPALLVSEQSKNDILFRDFFLFRLGWPMNVGKHYNAKSRIINESWVLNLRSTTYGENIMMDSFLRGMGEELEKKWTERATKHIDVNDELRDLHKVYIDSEAHLRRQEEDALRIATSYWKRYTEASEQRQTVSNKLATLERKLTPQERDDEDEDGDDE